VRNVKLEELSSEVPDVGTPSFMTPTRNLTSSAAFPNVTSARNPFQAIGFGILLLFLFILFSRTFDVVLSSLHIPYVVTCLVLAASIFGGGVMSVGRHKIGRYLLAFTAWMALTIPFSFWRSGSTMTFQGWLKAFVVYVCIVSLIATFDQSFRAIKVLGFSIAILAGVALLLGNTDNGRLFLSEGKFENPNDLGQIILIGLPFLWLMMKDSTQNLLFKIPPVMLSGLLLYVLLKTGSRGAMFGFLSMLVFMFFRSSMPDRLALLAVTLILCVIVALVAPSSLKRRYVTIFSSDTESASSPGDLSEIAVASAEARQRLLINSVMLTFKHPLLGVGPGMFADALEEDLRKEGKRVASQVSHNSYTQISSEMGFPGLFFYLAVIFSCFKATKSVEKISRSRRGNRWETIGNTAVCLRMTLVAFAVTAFFSSVAYQSLLPAIAGLCTALYLSVHDELAQEAAGVPAFIEESSRTLRPIPSAPRFPSPIGQRI
jgi:hypothetical protein